MKKNKTKRSASAERIRKAYENGDDGRVEVIPAVATGQENPNAVKRVCAYCRVSTDEDSQQSSYELQVQHYTQFITHHENWVLEGIYADEGISGTSIHKRDDFMRMIENCRAGLIDLVITKSISRFARNILDCLFYVRELKTLKPPVAVYFETENINTLDATSELVLAILSIVAQEESEQKSNSLKWSYRRRFRKGIPVNNMDKVYGYDIDDEGNIIINEKEAGIVRFIFKSYLEGVPTPTIAKALVEAHVRTKKGLELWRPETIIGMLRNEKYAGDMRMQKTVTIDFFTHKSVKNRGIAEQYVVRNYHIPIVARKDFDAVQEILASGGYKSHPRKKKNAPSVKFKPITSGLLAGFVPIPSAVEVIDIEKLKKSTQKIIEKRRKPKC